MEEKINANYKVLGGANEALIMNAIRQRGPISRVDIVKVTGLTAPTVTNISGKLIEAGLICEYMIGEYSGGRRPVLLKANPEIARLIIVDIRSKELLGYIVNSGMEIKEKINYNISHLSQDQVLALVGETIEICSSSKEGQTVAAIGIIVRGPVLSREGISLFSPSTGWRNVPLKNIFERRFNLPVFVENDMRAMAVGVYHYGAFGDMKNVVFLGVGGGIGSGIILNGELYRGMADSAGEVGHTVVDAQGPLCSCGNSGCLEALASETALVTMVVQAIKTGQTSLISELVNGDLEAVKPEHVYDAADQGDSVAILMLGSIGKYLGIGAANIINFFNPELLVVGGGIVKGRKFLEEPMRVVISKHALESAYSSVRVEFSAEGRESALKGIVDLVMEGLFCSSK